MTEDLELQQLRRRVSELEPLAGATQTLLARLRHDLNNPITAIAGLAELLIIRETGLTEDGRRRLRLIQETCEKMGERVRSASLTEETEAPPLRAAASGGACRS